MGFCLLFMFLKKQKKSSPSYLCMGMAWTGLNSEISSLALKVSFCTQVQHCLEIHCLTTALINWALPAVHRMYFLLPASLEAISYLNLSTELLLCHFMSLFGCIPSFLQDELCTSAAHVEMKSRMSVFDNGILLPPSHSRSVEVMSHNQNP